MENEWMTPLLTTKINLQMVIKGFTYNWMAIVKSCRLYISSFAPELQWNVLFILLLHFKINPHLLQLLRRIMQHWLAVKLQKFLWTMNISISMEKSRQWMHFHVWMNSSFRPGDIHHHGLLGTYNIKWNEATLRDFVIIWFSFLIEEQGGSRPKVSKIMVPLIFCIDNVKWLTAGALG